jgi:hypothetical protein
VRAGLDRLLQLTEGPFAAPLESHFESRFKTLACAQGVPLVWTWLSYSKFCTC